VGWGLDRGSELVGGRVGEGGFRFGRGRGYPVFNPIFGIEYPYPVLNFQGPYPYPDMNLEGPRMGLARRLHMRFLCQSDPART